MTDVTTLYLEAPALRDAGERVLSTDEMTGIQALERKHPTIPMGPGRVERREFEYIRRGTVNLLYLSTLFLWWQVVTDIREIKSRNTLRNNSRCT